ncbi:MAG: hypothetical protein HYY06_14710 [Deltaproteobacteria bacterium]|nr:hypothetical protein [Deltaproteobacteria bacterium]
MVTALVVSGRTVAAAEHPRTDDPTGTEALEESPPLVEEPSDARLGAEIAPLAADSADLHIDLRLRALRTARPTRLVPRISVVVRATWQDGPQVELEPGELDRLSLAHGSRLEWLVLAAWGGP